VKIWRLVSEKFFETEIILFWAPFVGGPDAKILFLSTQRPPTAQKILSPRTSHFGDMGSKVQLAHPFPINWVVRSPPYFAYGILGMTPKTLKALWKSREQFPRYSVFYRILLSEPIAEIPWCLLQLLMESLDTPPRAQYLNLFRKKFYYRPATVIHPTDSIQYNTIQYNTQICKAHIVGWWNPNLRRRWWCV